MPVSRNVRYVTVHPSCISVPKYTVTQIQAQKMVARGRAYWIAGTRSLREVNDKARGTAREWRIRSSAGFSVLQLTEPRARTSWAARLASKD